MDAEAPEPEEWVDCESDTEVVKLTPAEELSSFLRSWGSLNAHTRHIFAPLFHVEDEPAAKRQRSVQHEAAAAAPRRCCHAACPAREKFAPKHCIAVGSGGIWRVRVVCAHEGCNAVQKDGISERVSRLPLQPRHPAAASDRQAQPCPRLGAQAAAAVRAFLCCAGGHHCRLHHLAAQQGEREHGERGAATLLCRLAPRHPLQTQPLPGFMARTAAGHQPAALQGFYWGLPSARWAPQPARTGLQCLLPGGRCSAVPCRSAPHAAALVAARFARPATDPLVRCCLRLTVPESGIRSFCLKQGRGEHAALNCQEWVADWARGDAGVLPASRARLFYLAGPTRDILSLPASGAASYACGCCDPWAAHYTATAPELAADGSCRVGSDTYCPGDLAWLLPPGSPVDSRLELVRPLPLLPHRCPLQQQRHAPQALSEPAAALGAPLTATDKWHWVTQCLLPAAACRGASSGLRFLPTLRTRRRCR